ncbi:MAG: beta-N-acetylhexosaminidase [Pseudomonadota bacterium]
MMPDPGPVMLDLEGQTLTGAERELLRHPLVGGVIFFDRNIGSRDQFLGLVAAVRDLRPELLLAVDQEGGRVQRLREGYTRLPPMQALGEACERDPGTGRRLCHEAGWLLASEVLASGLDFSFAPVLDLDLDHCAVIASRAFHPVAEVAVAAQRAFIAGLHEAGMAVTGKHFPGHGGVRGDSHLETPVDPRPLALLRARDLRPFAELGGELDAVMPAHIVYPAVDPHPAGFSRFWIQQVLRGELGFGGVVFSDDLAMKGADLVGGYAAKARAARAAGCDMVLVCNHRSGALEVLRTLEGEPWPEASGRRLARMRARHRPDWSVLESSTRRAAIAAELAGL